MAGKRDKEPWPRCGFALADGSSCSSISAVREGGACKHHARLADATEVVEEDSAVEAADDPRGEVVDLHVSKDGRSPRERLAEDARREYAMLWSAVEGALNADKPHSVTCPGCKTRFQARVPDHTARLKATEIALREGFGKAPEQPKEPAKVEQVGSGFAPGALEQLTSEDLHVLVVDARLRHAERQAARRVGQDLTPAA